MSLAVVIPLYNAGRWIEGTLSDLLAQPTPPCKIVVVDDGSQDDGPAKVASFRNYVTLITQKNAGACVARNRGLVEVNDRFVMFLDADDTVEGDFIGGALRAMEAAGADIAFAPMHVTWPGGRTQDIFHYAPIPTPEAVFAGWLNHYSQAPCSVVWRTDFVRSIGGWDPRVLKNQDGEIAMRAMLSRPVIASFDDGRAIYRAHGEPSSVSRRLKPASLRSEIDLSRRLIEAARGTKFENGIGGFGVYLYVVARGAYQVGEPELAREALALSREVGFRGHHGSLGHRLASSILGLGPKTRLVELLRRHRPARGGSGQPKCASTAETVQELRRE